MQPKSQRISRSESGLLVIDIQERLLPAIYERERVVQNSLRLIKGSQILGLPLLVTEQYRRGLGVTTPEIAAAIAAFAPREKLTFSACGAEGFMAALKAGEVRQAVLCGIEAHVCVCQTCLDLLHEGLTVFVVADAISSRTSANHQIGLERMRDAGAAIVSTEMVLFELLEKAGTEEFKQILGLLK